LAEEERFELSKRYKRLPVFETGAFSRSATLPQIKSLHDFMKRDVVASMVKNQNFASIRAITKFLPIIDALGMSIPIKA
jgi:hypothetical protein